MAQDVPGISTDPTDSCAGHLPSRRLAAHRLIPGSQRRVAGQLVGALILSNCPCARVAAAGRSRRGQPDRSGRPRPAGCGSARTMRPSVRLVTPSPRNWTSPWQSPGWRLWLIGKSRRSNVNGRASEASPQTACRCSASIRCCRTTFGAPGRVASASRPHRRRRGWRRDCCGARLAGKSIRGHFRQQDSASESPVWS